MSSNIYESYGAAGTEVNFGFGKIKDALQKSRVDRARRSIQSITEKLPTGEVTTRMGIFSVRENGDAMEVKAALSPHYGTGKQVADVWIFREERDSNDVTALFATRTDYDKTGEVIRQWAYTSDGDPKQNTLSVPGVAEILGVVWHNVK
jgi:hypothetical protein